MALHRWARTGTTEVTVPVSIPASSVRTPHVHRRNPLHRPSGHRTNRNIDRHFAWQVRPQWSREPACRRAQSPACTHPSWGWTRAVACRTRLVALATGSRPGAEAASALRSPSASWRHRLPPAAMRWSSVTTSIRTTSNGLASSRLFLQSSLFFSLLLCRIAHPAFLSRQPYPIRFRSRSARRERIAFGAPPAVCVTRYLQTRHRCSHRREERPVRRRRG